jgi:exopolyphosphatase / guanosine-5'-triphosphate,3'-diphosphate pyrophosphatase
MRVAVVDVGSNSLRLLVAERKPDGLAPVERARAYLGLGAEVERLGRLTEARIEAAAGCVRSYVARARELGVDEPAVLVTAPGRQSANADRLVAELAAAAAAPVRVLSAEEEGTLAFHGAVAGLEDDGGTVAVCDVGGGSTELAVGTASAGVGWTCSLDIGALRLTARRIERDPPGKKAIAAARADAASLLVGVDPPRARRALATGGTARALGRVVGPTLGRDELSAALRKLARKSTAELVRRYGVSAERAQTLAAGAAILVAVQERLDAPLEVARGGLREGAALRLAEHAAAA